MHWWKYSVRAVWGPQSINIQTATQQTIDCIRHLRSCHSLLSQWSVSGPGKAPLLIEPDEIREQLLVAERLRNPTLDVSNAALSRTGFSRSFHAGPDKKNWIMLSVRCGSSEPLVANLCRLDLPQINPTTRALISTETLIRICAGLVKIWQPSYCNVSSAAYDQVVAEARGAKALDLRQPMAGWITYLAPNRGIVPTLPVQFERIPVEGGGTIIVVLHHPLDAANPAHLAALAQISGLLADAGLTEPVVSNVFRGD